MNINIVEKARQIYLKLFGPPSSHEEWANSFNIIAIIVKELK